jgi:hypothetical protein
VLIDAVTHRCLDVLPNCKAATPGRSGREMRHRPLGLLEHRPSRHRLGAGLAHWVRFAAVHALLDQA